MNADPLAALLLRENVLPPPRVEEAQERQVLIGGTLDTALLELGYLDERRLLELLPRAYNARGVQTNELKTIDRAVTSLFPRRLAEKHGVVPLDVNGRRLTVALAGPPDLALLDEIGFMLSVYVKPAVTTQARVAWALAAHYGVPLQPRMEALLGRVGESPEQVKQAVEQWAIAHPSSSSAKKRAPPPPPPTVAPPDDGSGWTIARHAGLPRESEAQSAPKLEAVDGGSIEATTSAAVLGAADIERETANKRRKQRVMWTVDDAIAELALAEDRDAMLDVVLRFGYRRLSTVAVFVLTRSQTGHAFVGWDVIDALLERKDIANFALPAEGTHALAQVHAMKSPFLGPLKSDDPLVRLFGRKARAVILVPILVGDRFLGVLYGDAGTRSIPPSSLAELHMVVPRLGKGLGNLILRKKKQLRAAVDGDAPLVVVGELVEDSIAVSAKAPSRNLPTIDIDISEIEHPITAPSSLTSDPGPEIEIDVAAIMEESPIVVTPRMSAAALDASRALAAALAPPEAAVAVDAGAMLASMSAHASLSALELDSMDSAEPVPLVHVKSPSSSPSSSPPSPSSPPVSSPVLVPSIEPTPSADVSPPPSREPSTEPVPAEGERASTEPVPADGERASTGPSTETTPPPLPSSLLAGIEAEGAPLEAAHSDDAAETTLPKAAPEPASELLAITDAKPERVLAWADGKDDDEDVRLDANALQDLEGPILPSPSVARIELGLDESVDDDDDELDEVDEEDIASIPDAQPVSIPDGPMPSPSSVAPSPGVRARESMLVATHADWLAHDDAFLDDIVGHLHRPGEKEKRAAVAAVVAHGSRALPSLARYFPGVLTVHPFGSMEHRPEVPELSDCLACLSKLGAESAAPILVGELVSDDRLHRWTAVYALSALRVPAALPRLAQRVFDPEPAIAALALEVLDAYRDDEAFPKVLAQVRDLVKRGDPFERERAIMAVGELKDRQALLALVDLIGTRPREIAEESKRALIDITKQDFGTAERRWRAWIADNDKTPRTRWLIDGLSAKDDEIRRTAQAELNRLTGQFFGYRWDAPRNERDASVQQWNEWWQQQAPGRWP